MNVSEKKINNKSIKNFFYYIILTVIILVIWHMCYVFGLLKPYSMPTITAVIVAAWEGIKDFIIINDVLFSFIRVLVGFLVAAVLAISLGIFIGISKRVELITDLTIKLLKPIPPIAWIPLAILWFGIGEGSKIFIIAIGAFFPILINVVDGIKNIDKRYLELSKVYEIPRRRVISKMILPGALPSIMTGIRVGLGNAWVCVVAAEMIAATTGVGYMIMDGRSLSRPDVVIVGMLIIGIVGKIMDDVIVDISKKVIKGRG